MGLSYIIVLPGAIVTAKDDNKNSYLLLFALFSATICIFPTKELFSSMIALRIWQICCVIEMIISIVLVFLCDKERCHAIITWIISVGFLFLPFYNTLNFSNEVFPINMAVDKIEVRVGHVMLISGIIFLSILIVSIVISIRRTKRDTLDYKLIELLRKNIDFYERREKFRSPMETLWSYEANSTLQQLESSIKQCISEIHLSQRSLFPRIIDSLNVDDMKPMLYRINAELVKLNSSRESLNDRFSDFSIIKDLNHSLATPLSQIEVQCELIKTKVSADIRNQLAQVIQYVNFCRKTIFAYKELLSSTLIGENSDYKSALMECFNMYQKTSKKNDIKLNIDGDEDLTISGNILLSIVSPLLENAVTATPINKEILLTIKKSGEYIKISIQNECINVPRISDLEKNGYSSKKDHQGTGLATVRHFLVLIKGKELQIEVNGNIVKFVVLIPQK